MVFASFSCLRSKARSTFLRLSNKKPKKTRCFFEVRKVLSNVKKSISLTFGSAKPLILTSQHGFRKQSMQICIHANVYIAT